MAVEFTYTSLARARLGDSRRAFEEHARGVMMEYHGGDDPTHFMAVVEYPPRLGGEEPGDDFYIVKRFGGEVIVEAGEWREYTPPRGPYKGVTVMMPIGENDG